MSSQKPRVAVRGSERVALQGAQIGAPDPNERIEVTVRVRRRNPLPDSALLEARAVQPEQRRHLSREEFEATYGADPDEIAKVEEFAHEHGLTTVEASGARRSVILAGTVAAMSEAFGVYLAHYQTPAGMHRGRTGVVTVPEDLAEIIEGVFGLDNRPQAKPDIQRLTRWDHIEEFDTTEDCTLDLDFIVDSHDFGFLLTGALGNDGYTGGTHLWLPGAT